MMTAANTNLVDDPIAIKDYQIYDVDNLPKMFFGFRIKDKFDEARLRIKTKYSPRSVAHFRHGSQLEPIFLYGIEIKPKPQYAKLLNYLNENRLIVDSDSLDNFYNNYRNTLAEYDLTCNECYSYTYDGIYPIDTKHLNTISVKDYTDESNSGFINMVNRSNIPWFLNLANFNLYVLCKCIDYDFDYLS
jgi:hypothetical protein